MRVRLLPGHGGALVLPRWHNSIVSFVLFSPGLKLQTAALDDGAGERDWEGESGWCARSAQRNERTVFLFIAFENNSTMSSCFYLWSQTFSLSDSIYSILGHHVFAQPSPTGSSPAWPGPRLAVFKKKEESIGIDCFAG